MTGDLQQMITILSIVLIVLSAIVVVLFVIYMILAAKNRKRKKIRSEGMKEKSDNKEITVKSNEDGYNKQSIFDFMEFEKVEDNMIVQKKGKKYLMVIECQGINFDLMSEVEKNSVEMAFWQFLNTLRHPIQIYVQTRTLNLERSIGNYKKRFNEIDNKYRNMLQKYKSKVSSGEYSNEELQKEYYELVKQRNLYEYGKDIIDNTERMSQNRNVLNKKYYIIIQYYNEGNELLDDSEISSIAFSELYSKAISIIRSLAPTGVVGKILSSNELVELLYIAYNRDETETFGLSRALAAKYDELYVTAPNVLDKRIQVINKEIENQARSRVEEKVKSINESKKQKRADEMLNNLEQLVNKRIMEMIDKNENYLGADVAEQAKKEFEEENGGAINNGEERKKKTRGRKKKVTE